MVLPPQSVPVDGPGSRTDGQLSFDDARADEDPLADGSDGHAPDGEVSDGAAVATAPPAPAPAPAPEPPTPTDSAPVPESAPAPEPSTPPAD
jgi:hypothetical protein